MGIGWVISQEGENGERFPIRFSAKVLNERQRRYAQVKRELWGIISVVKADRDHLIGTEVVVETEDCLPILSMVSRCATPDLSMLRWIAYIKSLNPEIRHIAGKDNCWRRPSGGTSTNLLLYCGEVRTCLVEGEKIRSEGGCFRSGSVEVGGQRNSRVREREIGTK
jgi:hypothetical protein